MYKKILFVHTSQENNEMEFKYMPSGMIGLANYLKKNGYNSLVLNTFIEKDINPDFSVPDYITKNNIAIVCLALHWHYQTTAVIDLAKQIKEKNPKVKIVLGGLTASFFANDILIEFPWIDYIVKGEAEVPLLNLVKALDGGDDDFTGIKNLTYKSNDTIAQNKIEFICDNSHLRRISLTDTTNLLHAEHYKKLNISDEKKTKWMFIYNCGRGCSVNCSFCGGSRDSLKLINNRKDYVFVDHETALKELRNLADSGIGMWYTSFDPDPQGDYYIELFRKLREEKIKLQCKFECWSLPRKEFIDEFKKTFDEESVIVISPETGSEKVRDKNKGFSYENSDLINFMGYLERKDIMSVVFFTAGLPFETREDFLKTLSLVNMMKKRLKNAKIIAVPIEIEPASPLFMNNEKYGIKTKRKTIKDYYEVHKGKSTVGYETEHFSEEEIPELATLINAEVYCRYEKSIFYKALIDFMFSLDKIDFKTHWKLCSECQYFKDCFL